ncbi:uncharacterized protein LOC143857230 isoform X2 [Tasmannia lanceolata]|uniref:uncharacterized protein LOC143857230 isoform X2 n=1 Tax=Tasmannia lanceolata TaxID=3420 RepID=UPI00406417AE
MSSYNPIEIIPMDLAIMREMACGRRPESQPPANLHDFRKISKPSDSLILDSVLREREIGRKRLREVATKMATERPKMEMIPVEVSIQRNLAYQRQIERGSQKLRGDFGSISHGLSSVSSNSDFVSQHSISHGFGSASKILRPMEASRKVGHERLQEETASSEITKERSKMAKGRVLSWVDIGESSSSVQNPRSKLLGMKSQASPGNAISVRLQQSRNRQPPSNSNLLSLRCNLCQVSCSSIFNLKQHLEGKPHKDKQEQLEGRSKNNNEEANKMVASNNLNQRFQGKQHKAKESSENGSNEGSKPVWCNVCRIQCPCMASYVQHLTGKKHAAQLHTTFGIGGGTK